MQSCCFPHKSIVFWRLRSCCRLKLRNISLTVNVSSYFKNLKEGKHQLWNGNFISFKIKYSILIRYMLYLFSFWKVQIAGKSRGFRIPYLKWQVRVIACSIWQNTIQARNSRSKQSVPFLTREVVSRQYSSLLLCSSFYNLFVSLTNPT